jgi:hypothetical protein
MPLSPVPLPTTRLQLDKAKKIHAELEVFQTKTYNVTSGSSSKVTVGHLLILPRTLSKILVGSKGYSQREISHTLQVGLAIIYAVKANHGVNK